MATNGEIASLREELNDLEKLASKIEKDNTAKAHELENEVTASRLRREIDSAKARVERLRAAAGAQDAEQTTVINDRSLENGSVDTQTDTQDNTENKYPSFGDSEGNN